MSKQDIFWARHISDRPVLPKKLMYLSLITSGHSQISMAFLLLAHLEEVIDAFFFSHLFTGYTEYLCVASKKKTLMTLSCS